jgi:hypothetical protein
MMTLFNRSVLAPWAIRVPLLSFNQKIRRERAMNRSRLFMLTALVVAIAGCTSTRQDVDPTSVQTPVQVQLGEADSPLGPIRICSGQLISLPLCCPPVELRDAKGTLVLELNCTREPQPLVAGAGTYFIVGHDPGGRERVLRLEVTKR